MSGPYINDKGFEVPENNIVVVFSNPDDDSYKEIVVSLIGQSKRDWFDPNFYYCLPLNIGNQYGFAIRSMSDVELFWGGRKDADSLIIKINGEKSNHQFYGNDFGHGILTVQNSFHFKTPPGINLMTIQPPNFFIPGLSAMTGVIETDNIRRDFTFNIKITEKNKPIKIKKGDMIAAFIPIPRNFVENFTLESVFDVFPKELHDSEMHEGQMLGLERTGPDKDLPRLSGRRYFKGIHTDGTEYKNHQKKLI